jgi:hypothetical protein
MKLVLALSVLAAAVGAKLWIGGDCGPCAGGCPLTSWLAGASETPAASAPAGRYVEARTVNVFAGACHYNGEVTSGGREAVLAWSFESGAFEGTDLSGVDVIAAVAASGNLDRSKGLDLGSEAPAEVRRSIVYVDAGASEAQRGAAVRYVRQACGDALGEVLAVEPREIEVDVQGDRYFAHAGDKLRLEGSALPDRDCCKMPYDVWYEPLAPVDDRVVGNSERFDWQEKRLAPPFERHAQNDAFLGSFGAAKPASCCAQQPSPRS